MVLHRFLITIMLGYALEASCDRHRLHKVSNYAQEVQQACGNEAILTMHTTQYAPENIAKVSQNAQHWFNHCARDLSLIHGFLQDPRYPARSQDGEDLQMLFWHCINPMRDALGTGALWHYSKKRDFDRFVAQATQALIQAQKQD
jgi:hypothetical protein